MGWLAWIVFGALAGGVAGMIAGSKRSGCLFNIVIGIVGAFLGGLIMQFVTGSNFNFQFNLSSFVVAVIGSVVLLVITGATKRK
ncbi:MAG: GlsB/YeaQ/YmgE family stress response membrane protein [Anaerolineales bacterium]|nr:GlsB/YeaQ/YmgE family stress response membrane protein [Anaerolineales bacterium]MCA9927704.1 GlsB/YeaQ/YmgE family stress response membrane protein [Anaerolineales bacterium]